VPAQSSAPAPNSSAVNLQTGLFSQYANAVNLMERLKRAGFSPFLEQRTQGGNTFWAVLVPSGPDVNASIRALRTAGFESFPLR
jgi:cell division septation protein DedD